MWIRDHARMPRRETIWKIYPNEGQLSQFEAQRSDCVFEGDEKNYQQATVCSRHSCKGTMAELMHKDQEHLQGHATGEQPIQRGAASNRVSQTSECSASVHIYVSLIFKCKYKISHKILGLVALII